MKARTAALLGSFAIALAGLSPAGAVPSPTPATVTAEPTAGPWSVRLIREPSHVDEDRIVGLRLRCRTQRRCTGTVRIRHAGEATPAKRYRLAPRSTGRIQLLLSGSQYDALESGRRLRVAVVVRERRPQTRKPRVVRVPLVRTDVPSYAFSERNWTPTVHDTCSAELHATFSVIGPDGKRYPTWHPPTVTDPATGQKCTFGHEHGADPTTSHIYPWVTRFLQGPGGSRQRGIPFGQVSEASTVHSDHGGHAMRHEDNVGHKIIVANDIQLVGASPRRRLTTEVDGEEIPLTCDYLIKLHQGSHSSDAFRNNAHELLYAAKCADGTALISATLARFGNANEFNPSCRPDTVIETEGSDLPDGEGGRRLIPDRTCIDEHVLTPPGRRSDIWGIYEVWESMASIERADGTTIASYSPWLAVRNPSRYYDNSTAESVGMVQTRWLTDPADEGVAQGFPWSLLEEDAPRDQQSPYSPFDGAQRDYYLQETTVTNADGPTVWHTDPYGEGGSVSPFHGSVKQYVWAGDNSWLPELERRQFGLQDDFGPDGSGVHAPN